MKHTWFGLLMAAVLTAGTMADADAKRLGGGRSSGMQRDMPARTAPDAPPGKPAAPAQQQAQNAATPGAAAAPAAAPKRNWLGPIAGLAAGLGLAALFSHLGLGAELAQFVMLAVLVLAGFLVVRWLLRRNAAAKTQPLAAARTAYAGAPADAARGPQIAWPPGGSAGAAAGTAASGTAASGVAASGPAATGAAAIGAAATAAALPAATQPPASRVFVPAAFDAEGFARTAKLIFLRLQAANDKRDLDDLRSFTTPELYAEISLDIQERGTGEQHTEVLNIDASVLDVANEPTRQVVSVRFRGQLREDAGAAATEIDEVWHLVKPLDDSRSWAIAGIEQMA